MITHNQKLVVNTKHTFLGTPPYKHEQRRCASVLLDPRWKVTPLISPKITASFGAPTHEPQGTMLTPGILQNNHE